MKLQSLVVAMTALSLSAGAMAAKQSAANNHSNIIQYVEGNSYVTAVPHNYLDNKDHGFWLGAYGQISGAYNTNYLLKDDVPTPNYLGTKDSSLTFSLDNADLLFGYDSNSVGMFTDLGYSNVAGYDRLDPSAISMHDTGVKVQEAFLTYQFNAMFAVKAGKFISDYGYYHPYQPLHILASSAITRRPVMGVEGVFAANNFHASIAGVSQNGSATGNNARPHIVIMNAGYNVPSQYGTLKLQASYANMSPLALYEKNMKVPAWLVGGAFSTQNYSISAHVQSLRAKEFTYKPWVYDANFNYILNSKTTVGAYGNYMYNTPALLQVHWLVGVTGSYSINHYVTANVYAQRVQVTTDAKAAGYENNVTFMGALSFKI